MFANVKLRFLSGILFRPKMSFGGDISLTYLRNIKYEWELGSGGGGRGYFYINFYQMHSVLHFNRK